MATETHFLVDVVIPALNELGYIERTLMNLTQQTLYKRGQMHIIVGDFKDDLNMADTRLEQFCKKLKNVEYLPLYKKGIAWSRNEIIRQKAVTNVFMMIDADSKFNRPDGAEFLIRPIIDNEARMTNCDVLFQDDKTGEVMTQPTNFYEFAANVANLLEQTPFAARSSGLTVSRDAFNTVGGFREGLNLITEDWMMAFDVCMQFTIYSKRHVREVKIYSSNRRAKGFDKDGFSVLNYDGGKAYE